MITIRRYSKEDATEWDAFVDASKNGTFMLKRGYIDYHSDRFEDYSLMFYDDSVLVALLPASVQGDEMLSHGGLTYGGIIMAYSTTQQQILNVFEAMQEYLHKKGILQLIYKRIPSIYYSYPSDEDLYALFRCNAELIRQDVSTTIYLPSRICFSNRRRRGVKNARKENIIIQESSNYREYISLLSEVLKKYHNATPVHSADELELLANRFPVNIKLFAAFKQDKMLAGVVTFITPHVVHTQYIANSDEGRACGALDAVMDYLINERFSEKNYFDFGISTEQEGTILNEGLITQKQEFGGRTITYNFWRLKI